MSFSEGRARLLIARKRGEIRLVQFRLVLQIRLVLLRKYYDAAKRFAKAV
jgi:hypothetical protein